MKGVPMTVKTPKVYAEEWDNLPWRKFQANLDRLQHRIYKAAKNYFPDLQVSFPSAEKIWHGFRPLSPDGLPYIGRHSKYENLLIAGGHGMLGISLAAGTGKLIDEIISGHKLSIDISAFDVER
jgi:D-amino-acid dehydrogenase